MAGYRHPPGLGPQTPGVPPGYMLVDVPDRGLGSLGQGGAASGVVVFLLGLGIGYFLGHSRAGAKVRRSLARRN